MISLLFGGVMAISCCIAYDVYQENLILQKKIEELKKGGNNEVIHTEQ